ncbi:hypothetical protein CCR97_09510 [Rhodoplanes elegans]|uniref:Hydroxyacid dehydrogenase n=1 Tax=Rhodoplanes elegans TaxID=29408 RepID=A0A327KUL3_9BRAD|nr:hydroxyacid dehydrogenase [Rhodoplanes elegans]MBK5958443.1 hypothetical protein [Rhodoplanes elegans]RAI41135.1 hypothetical protein CH338_04000 [Rhodoplanes elegans]
MNEVFVLEPVAAEAIALLAERVPVVALPQSREIPWVGRAAAVIVRAAGVTAAEIAAAAPTLKVIGKHGAGVDAIDLAAARAHGVRVVSTPDANSCSVAELTLGLTLALARRIPLADRRLRTGTPLSPAERIGTELTGKTFGVVGFGAIGRRVAALVRAAFDATVVAFDPGVASEVFADAGAIRVATLPELLARADVVTVHVPLLPATRGLIGAAELAAMKPGALLVNTARGGVIDETALHEALCAGRIGGAASDVFVAEPPSADHPLLGLPGFVATPHIGGTTTEALSRMGRDVAAGVLDVLEGRPPRFPVV